MAVRTITTLTGCNLKTMLDLGLKRLENYLLLTHQRLSEAISTRLACLERTVMYL